MPRNLIIALVAAACFGAPACAGASLGSAVLPSQTDFEVRLLTKLSSRSSKAGDPVQAAIIGPVVAGSTIVPLRGSMLTGRVVAADALGLGLRRSAADLEVSFDTLSLPDGQELPISAKVAEVETARERVDGGGRIVGVDPAANLSSGFSFLMSTVLWHTELEAPALIVKVLAARSPDSEITLPVGTEMFVRLENELSLDGTILSDYLPGEVPFAEVLQVRQVQSDLPSQRCQFTSHRASDFVNVALLGSEKDIRRAFAAAGWSGETRHSPLALYGLFHSMVQRQGFGMAPMSAMSLNGKPATVTFQKSLNTISKRHHIRLWKQADSQVWLGAATEDIGIRVSRMRITHATAPRIDNERAKVINDLWSAGCVQQASLLPRDGVSSLGKGDGIATDGDLAILRVGACSNSSAFPKEPHWSAEARLRRAFVAVVVDLVRANPLTVGVTTAHTLGLFLRRTGPLQFNARPYIERVSIAERSTELVTSR